MKVFCKGCNTWHLRGEKYFVEKELPKYGTIEKFIENYRCKKCRKGSTNPIVIEYNEKIAALIPATETA